MPTIDLSPEEIGLLRSALESTEYWEYRDVLPHGSGYIYDPESMVEPYTPDEEQQEALDEIKTLRELDARLYELEKSLEVKS